MARAVGTSDGYVWKLEQGLINLQNVPLPKIGGLLKVLRWTPEEFTLATGVPLPGLSERAGVDGEAAPGVPLYKVPVYGEEEVHLVLGLPGLTALRHGSWLYLFRRGEPPEPGRSCVAEGEEGAFPGEYLGLNPKRSHLVRTLDCPGGIGDLPKGAWRKVHRVVLRKGGFVLSLEGNRG
ncbi:hypothetical protein FJNA_24430 [Thermus sp. FJN-A]